MFNSSSKSYRNIALLSNLQTQGLNDVFGYLAQNNYQANINPILFPANQTSLDKITQALDLILHLVRFHQADLPIHELAIVRGGGESEHLEIYNAPEIIRRLEVLGRLGVAIHCAIGHASDETLIRDLITVCNTYGQRHITPTAYAVYLQQSSQPGQYLNGILTYISRDDFQNLYLNYSLISTIANADFKDAAVVKFIAKHPELAKAHLMHFRIMSMGLGKYQRSTDEYQLKFVSLDEQRKFTLNSNRLAFYLFCLLFFKRSNNYYKEQKEPWTFHYAGILLAKLASKKALQLSDYTLEQYANIINGSEPKGTKIELDIYFGKYIQAKEFFPFLYQVYQDVGNKLLTREQVHHEFTLFCTELEDKRLAKMFNEYIDSVEQPQTFWQKHFYLKPKESRNLRDALDEFHQNLGRKATENEDEAFVKYWHKKQQQRKQVGKAIASATPKAKKFTPPKKRRNLLAIVGRFLLKLPVYFLVFLFTNPITFTIISFILVFGLINVALRLGWIGASIFWDN